MRSTTRHGKRRAEDDFRAFVELAPDATVVAGRDGRIRLVNQQTEALFGYPRAELIGQPVERLIPERFHAAHRRYRAAYATAPYVRPMGVNLPLFGRRYDGGEFPVEVSLSPVERPGEFLVISSIRDITERKRLEQVLAEHRRRFECLLAACPDHIFLLDPLGRFTYVNPAAATVIAAANGRPADVIVGHTARELGLPPEFIRQFEQQQALARAGQIVVAETPFPDPRGIRRFEYVLTPIYTEDGRLEAIAGVTRDIEERTRLEQRTQTALEALVALAQALAAPLGAADSATRGATDSGIAPGTGAAARHLAEAALGVFGGERALLIAIDPETEQLRPLEGMGWSVEDESRWADTVAQFHLSDCVSPNEVARLHAGEVIVYDPRVARRKGFPTTLAYPALAAPMRLGTELVGVLAVDLGANHRVFTATERALAGAIADLAALVLQRDRLLREREEARVRELAWQETTRRMDEFLATASHDMRTPLTVTMGEIALATRWFERLAAAVLEQSPGLADRVEAVRRTLDETSQSVDRLGQLVAVLFDTALVRSGKLELHCTPCDLVALVREAVEAQRQASPHRTIALRGAARRQLQVEADRVRMGQVLTNYLTNALKYSPADQPVAVRVQRQGAAARVAVTDHGPGLTAQEQGRIWQAFYRAEGVRVQSGSSAGLGLGLHICKTIVECHSGQVGIDSTVGKGSTFWFTLPLATAPPGGDVPPE